MNYLTSPEICGKLKITTMTLKRWKDNGKIRYIKLSSRKFLYDIDSVLTDQTVERQNIIYARVSTSAQIDDLHRQTEILREYIAANGKKTDATFTEIASGMNENRPELTKMIKLIIEGQVDTVYVSYKDRLTRFGFDYFTNFFNQFGTKIEVINSTAEEDFPTELTDDLVSIIHHFSMKMYSHRRAVLKNVQKELLSVDKQHKTLDNSLSTSDNT